MIRAYRLRRWLWAGSLAWACSVQVPDEEELFANAGRGGTGASGGNAGTAGASGSSGSAGADASSDGAAGDGALAEGGDAADSGPFDPSVGLVLHYKFDESAGDIVHDQNSTDKNARILNIPAVSPWVATGKVGGALRLPGGRLSDAGPGPMYVELPHNVLTDLAATTIATWFRWEGGDAPQHVFDLGSDLSAWIYFTPYFGNGARVAARKPIGDNFLDVDFSKDPSVSTWTHVAITWDAARIEVYLDGVRVGGLTPPKAPATGEVIIPSDLGQTARNWIGRSQFTVDTFNDPFFSGMVDEFRIYDRVLPAAHVAALKALGE